METTWSWRLYHRNTMAGNLTITTCLPGSLVLSLLIAERSHVLCDRKVRWGYGIVGWNKYPNILAIQTFHNNAVYPLIDDKCEGCMRWNKNPISKRFGRESCFDCRKLLIRDISESRNCERMRCRCHIEPARNRVGKSKESLDFQRSENSRV
jgi:hypothetical protein